jgi:hypothetical protein
MTIVYDGGRQEHMTSEELYAYLAELDAQNSALPFGERSEINDRAAQTIAAMWHSPGNESTALSTAGWVTVEMSPRDFYTVSEYQMASAREKRALDYLATYILSKQV